MKETPRSSRLHIGIFGRRNVGKSSLINAITGQDVALVSSIPGTTTDPVYKAMELDPLGPVVFIDTPGIDDEGPIGELRIKKTQKVFSIIDLGVLVIDPGIGVGTEEENLIKGLQEREIPAVCVLNKSDLGCYGQDKAFWEMRLGSKLIEVSTKMGVGLNGLKEALSSALPKGEIFFPIVSDLISQGGTALLVIPIDHGAPKGRLILPQVQTIRDILDNGRQALVVNEEGVNEALNSFNIPPDIVITDSRIFEKVSREVPLFIPLTSFSILFARIKGDLKILVSGAQTVESLRPGDRVLIAEACTHHPSSDDIGRVKIPTWLNEKVGGELDYLWSSGASFPDDHLDDIKLVIHCGGCMITRRQMLQRIREISDRGIPVVNYGILISYLHGVFPRAIEPFSMDKAGRGS
jgi:[FeFe] hydrogenase H-cluster maturation GTPase HydF